MLRSPLAKTARLNGGATPLRVLLWVLLWGGLLGAAVSCGPRGGDSSKNSDGEGGGNASSAESPDGAKPFAGGLESARASKVLTAPLIQREMVRAISTTVNAASEREIQVFPRTNGIVTDVLVEEGDRVEKDAPLMLLDPRELEAALAEAQIALREAKDGLATLSLAITEADAQIGRAELTYDQSVRELERKEGAGEGILSRNELDVLRLTVLTNKADLAAQKIAKQRAETALTSQDIAIEKAELSITRAELNRSYATVTAPFGGVISQRTVREGDLVSGTTTAFTLTDPDNVRAVVSRPQRELRFFRAAEMRAAKASEGGGGSGLDIEISPEALPGFSYTGKILFVSPTIDAASGQFRVTLGVNQPEEGDDRPPVLPGMLLRVRIVTERHTEALVVPKRALLREGESYFVFVANDKVAEKVRVTEGFADDDFVEVIPADAGALTEGADVIVVGNRDLEDGDAVDASVWPAAQSKETVEEGAEEDTDESSEESTEENAEEADDEASTEDAKDA